MSSEFEVSQSKSVIEPIGKGLARPVSIEELEDIAGAAIKTQKLSGGGNGSGEWRVDGQVEW
ncbi:hypothetical protein OHC51_12975 [Stenotrophomonas indicatrix]|jgi:hypothetical protein|uniref:hypothetical protein n=1 Tax=Stenotrophomonas indicatrix TaxID=2045451 RepID=UPI00300B291C